MGIPIQPDHEIIKEALEKIVELIQFCVKYNHPENLIDLREIKKTLELSVNFQLKHKPDWYGGYVMEEWVFSNF